MSQEDLLKELEDLALGTQNLNWGSSAKDVEVYKEETEQLANCVLIGRLIS